MRKYINFVDVRKSGAMTMKTTLIISTYNRSDALRLCLLSAFHQTYLPDEIVVGDDGSRPDTAAMIAELRTQSPVPLIHVWQPDEGFRLARMRNQCVAASHGDYIIETDGDVILHPRFVEDHVNMARIGHYLKGGRVNLGKQLTEKVCGEGKLYRPTPFTSGIEAKAENGFHLPVIADWLAPHYRRNREGALGCNMSFFRADFTAINGYDEFYVGWGGEDGDFGRRLKRSGLKKRHLKFAGIIYHLWHEDKHMQNKEKNFAHSMRPDEEQPVYCIDGFDKYDPALFSDSDPYGRLIYDESTVKQITSR